MNYPPQFRPPRKGTSNLMGCFMAIAIVVGSFVALAIVVAVFAHRTSAVVATGVDAGADPTEEEIMSAIAINSANEADAAAQANAAREAKLRAGCRLKPAQPIFLLSYDDERDRCHQEMQASRTARDTELSFPSPDEDTPTLTTTDGCKLDYESWAEGKNAFGVVVRTRYRCTLDPRTGLFTTKTL